MLITYEEALSITEKSDAFYVQRGEIEGFEYAMFNYRLAMENDFIENDAWELRGLTYIKSGDTWVIYPMLTKFLNLNQGTTTQYNIVKDKKVASVEYKEDGSLITLMCLPDGKVVPKTKMSFENDQTNMVKKIMKDNKQLEIITSSNSDLTFLFELVSPKNKIVLKYNKTELRLLQIRERTTGKYRDDLLESTSKSFGVRVAEKLNHALDELIELRETEENIEGWVVKFEDGQFIKVKTSWYIEKHGLMDDLSQEHKIIAMILEDNIDDVLGELEDGSEEKVEINTIMGIVDKYFNHRVQRAYDLRDRYYNEFNGSRKDFAIACSKLEDFGLVMKNLKGDGIEKSVKERILVELSHLQKAREFIEEYKEK